MAESTATPNAIPATPAPFTGTRWVLMIIVIAMANFMEVLDLSIANVSLTTIAGSLGVSVTEGTWVITSYAVANAVSVPLAAWFSRRFGQVRVFTFSLATFVAASAFCGLSISLGMLVTGRLLQGLAAGLMIPLSQALILNNSPPDKKVTALLVWTITMSVGPVTGPLVGGWITDNYHWSWIFFINIPPGIVAPFAIWYLMKDHETPTAKLPVDVIGVVLLVIWVGAAQILLDKGNELDWFESSTIIMLAVVAVIGFCAFLAWELTDEHPIVDFSLFRYRNFTVGMVVVATGFCAFFATVVLLPIVLQTSVGYTAQWAGRVMALNGASAILMSPLVARMLKKIDPRFVSMTGFLTFAASNFWRMTFTTGSSLVDFLLPQIVQGCAISMFFAPVLSILTGGLPPQYMASAGGFQTFGRMMLASFGASLMITFWDHRAVEHRSRLVEALPDHSTRLNDGMAALHQVGFPDLSAYGVIDHEITAQSMMLAANDMFLIAAIVFVFISGIIWLARPPFGAGGGGH
jgi:DHA2 family multidrug resistance protein